MPTETQSEVEDCLRSLASQPGTLWSGLINRSSTGFVSMTPSGSLRQSGPAESVLVEAIMTASNALSERLGLGRASDFEHRFEAGGLLIHAPDPSRCLIVCHTKEAPIPLLRMALREAAQTLPPQSLPTAPDALDSFYFSDPGPLGDNAGFSTPANRGAPPHSEVYNPFTSA